MIRPPLKLGFIGGGLNSAIGETHFIASQMDGYFSIAAGCFSTDNNINHQTALRRGIPTNRTYDSWQALLESEKNALDAIVILTPTPSHYAIVNEALRSGLKVICEKSLATSSEESRKIEKDIENKNGQLYVTYNYTGYPMVRELREMIKSHQLGKIKHLQIEMPQEGFSRLGIDGNPTTPQKWRLMDGEIPTISLDLGVHLHHLVYFLIEENPFELVATQTTDGNHNGVIDNVNSLIRYTNGIGCNAWFSKTSLGKRNGLRVRIYGDRGSAEWHQFEPEILIFHDCNGRSSIIDRANIDVKVANLPRYNRFKPGHPAGFLEAFANLYTDFAHYISGNSSEIDASIYSAKHATEGLRLMECISRSATNRSWVKI